MIKSCIFIVILLFFSHCCTAQTVTYTYKNNEANLTFDLIMDKNDKEISEWRMIINAKGEIVKKNNSPFFHKKNKFYFFDKTLSNLSSINNYLAIRVLR